MSENQANNLPPGSIKSNRNGELIPGILVVHGEEHVKAPAMTITRRSPVSGTTQTMTVHISNRHLLQWQQGEITLAEVEPPLTTAERRFLEYGMTPEDDAALAVLE
jgi:hypothetical protein